MTFFFFFNSSKKMVARLLHMGRGERKYIVGNASLKVLKTRWLSHSCALVYLESVSLNLENFASAFSYFHGPKGLCFVV